MKPPRASFSPQPFPRFRLETSSLRTLGIMLFASSTCRWCTARGLCATATAFLGVAKSMEQLPASAIAPMATTSRQTAQQNFLALPPRAMATGSSEETWWMAVRALALPDLTIGQTAARRYRAPTQHAMEKVAFWVISLSDVTANAIPGTTFQRTVRLRFNVRRPCATVMVPR